MFFLIGDKNDLGQLLNGIGDDIVDKLIIHPQESSFQGLIGGSSRFSSDFCGGGGKLVQVWCNNFV
jgi:hypothetical protein